MLLTVAGTFVGVPEPQAATVPSLRTPNPKVAPAAIATTLDKLAGTFVPTVEPQATTVPSDFRASENELLAARATTLLRPGGGTPWPLRLSPHCATGPGVSIATELVIAPATLVTMS